MNSNSIFFYDFGAFLLRKNRCVP